jgi:hypothetical protein
MGCVIEASGEERHGLLVADYLKAVEDGKSALIIAPTHAEGQKLTDELRAALKNAARWGKSTNSSPANRPAGRMRRKGDVRNYEPGMVVEFHQNAKGFDKRAAKRPWCSRKARTAFAAKAGRHGRAALDQTDRFEVFRTREIALPKATASALPRTARRRSKARRKARA